MRLLPSGGMGRPRWAAAMLLGLSGCGLFGGGDVADRAPVPHWRSVATHADRDRLLGWRRLWQEAIGTARREGFGDQMAREGMLLQPDVGQADPLPPPGSYRCRLLRLGGSPSFQSHRPVACRVSIDRGRHVFEVVEGVQRPSGALYPGGDLGRRIFIGTMSLGDERRAPVYGVDRTRDMIGHFEALPPHRWRLVLPRPHWGAAMDMIEIRPAR